MKRVIKYWNRFSSDETKFSDCGTEYEVLPILVSDDAGLPELRKIARELGIKTTAKGKTSTCSQEWSRPTEITHSLKTGEKTEPKFSSKEVFEWYLGFATLNESGPLGTAVKKPKTKMTKAQARQIVDERAYGVADLGDFSQTPGRAEWLVIMESWKYFHEMRLLGYDTDQFQTLLGAAKDSDGRVFEDSVDYCSDCGTWDERDDGYNYNHRYVEHVGNLGIRCGCYDEYCAGNVQDFVNDPKTPMTLEIAERLEKEGKLKFMERFIGGMTDGRGGSFRGESTREGDPESVLEEYREKFPKGAFVFTHDESGQFQTYFSIWKVNKNKVPKARKVA